MLETEDYTDVYGSALECLKEALQDLLAADGEGESLEETVRDDLQAEIEELEKVEEGLTESSKGGPAQLAAYAKSERETLAAALDIYEKRLAEGMQKAKSIVSYSPAFKKTLKEIEDVRLARQAI